jgi:hypothetical protein
MWNEKDAFIAAERYADMRRSAEQHNAAARMMAERQAVARAGAGAEMGPEMSCNQPPNKRSYNIRQHLRKALALGSTYVYR